MQRVQNAVTLGLVLLGPVLAGLTFIVLGPLDQGNNSPSLRLVLLADLVYVLVVAALVLRQVAQMIAARRAQSAGSRLHLRLTGVFALLALIPTVLVAVFAVLTVNIGLEGWFSERVRNVVGTSLSAAEAYENEHRDDLTRDATSSGGLSQYRTAGDLLHVRRRGAPGAGPGAGADRTRADRGLRDRRAGRHPGARRAVLRV